MRALGSAQERSGALGRAHQESSESSGEFRRTQENSGASEKAQEKLRLVTRVLNAQSHVKRVSDANFVSAKNALGKLQECLGNSGNAQERSGVLRSTWESLRLAARDF